MNKIIILFIISIGILYGCINRTISQNETNLEKVNAEYLKNKSYFDSSFVDFFPSIIKHLPAAIEIDTNAISDHVRFILYDYIDAYEFDSLENIIRENSEAEYKPDDTCLLVVNRFTTKENWHLHNKNQYVIKEELSRDCYKSKLPVPNFWDNPDFTSNTDVKLPNDYTLYVLEAKSGKYWDNSHLTDGRYMPIEWKNGYSKGVAMSRIKNIIIYWFIIW